MNKLGMELTKKILIWSIILNLILGISVWRYYSNYQNIHQENYVNFLGNQITIKSNLEEALKNKNDKNRLIHHLIITLGIINENYNYTKPMRTFIGKKLVFPHRLDSFNRVGYSLINQTILNYLNGKSIDGNLNNIEEYYKDLTSFLNDLDYKELMNNNNPEKILKVLDEKSKQKLANYNY